GRPARAVHDSARCRLARAEGRRVLRRARERHRGPRAQGRRRRADPRLARLDARRRFRNDAAGAQRGDLGGLQPAASSGWPLSARMTRRAVAALLSVAALSTAVVRADDVTTVWPHAVDGRFWASGQVNAIFQWHPAFHAPYSGPNSLRPDRE